jgi:predicted RNA-binding Zn-ribbon protein involved in translation (DUF1610 family)
MNLKFSNQEVKKITNLISTGKKWSYPVSSIDGKIDWVIQNNPSKNKIDVIANKKFIDDYKYDKEEKDDVYATVLNVLDYLTNIVNKYNKRNPLKESEEEITEKEIKSLYDLEVQQLKKLRKSKAYGKGGQILNPQELESHRSLFDKGLLQMNNKDSNSVLFTKKGRNLINAILESNDIFFNIEMSTDEFHEAISQGMLRAYSKRIKEEGVHYTCKACEQNIPKYKGKYPAKCPKCGDSIKAMKENDKDEAIWGGPFKRGTEVRVRLEDPDVFYNATLVTYNPSTNEYGAELKSGDDVGKIIQGIKTGQIN